MDPEMRLAMRTRERPRYRRAVKELCEFYNCTLVDLWHRMQANPGQFYPNLVKQCRRMLWQRRIKEYREAQQA
jgi:hypothetical protein